MPTSIERAVRATTARARALVRGFAGPRGLATRVPTDRVPPPPGAFARFGTGSWVVPPAQVIGADAIEIGDGVVVLEKSALLAAAGRGVRMAIGDRTRLGPGTVITCITSVTIGADVSSSDHAAITDTWGPFDDPRPFPDAAPVVVEDGAYLGFGSIVGPGVRIGAGAFVGEGAVVLADVEPHTVVYGNPARVVRHWDERAQAWAGSRFP